LYRVTKKGGMVCWVVQDQTVDGFKTCSTEQQCLWFKEQGFRVHEKIIYEKHAFAYPFMKGYHQVWEMMYKFSKGEPKTFNPIKDKINKSYIKGYTFGKKRRKQDGSMSHEDDTERLTAGRFGKRFNIWRYIVGKGNSSTDEIAFKHPAIFPEQLAKDLIISYSNKGDVVLDCFHGSGTTGKMCVIKNSRYIGNEISEEYCKNIDKRINIYKHRLQSLGQYIPPKRV
jgi:site-specific DNA-methyltransferase (adenine-specific)